MRDRAGALIVLITIVVGACADQVPSLAPTGPVGSTDVTGATASPIESPDPELDQAVRFRHDFGLRSDLAYVTASLVDPNASEDPFGVPLYPNEVARLFADQADQNAAIPIVVGYGMGHVDEYGGVYIDRADHNGMVTALWTDHLSEHASVLAGLLGGHAIIVRRVRYSHAELDALADRLFADIDWMEAIPARMESLGVGVSSNAVHMGVSSAESTAVQQIAAHYGLGDKLVVTSDGTGAALIPGGDVKGKVVLKNGKLPGPRADLQIDYVYQPDVPGSCGGGDMGYGVMPDGTFTYPCQAGMRILVIYGDDAKGNRVELGRTTVNVIAGKTVAVTMRLTKDP